MVRYILLAILVYLAYQFVFRLVMPVYLASRKIKKGFREMQEKMQEHNRRQKDFANPYSKPTPAQKINPEDYIEFEEVK